VDRGSLQSLRIRRAQAHDVSEVVAAIDAVCAEGIYLLTERYSATLEWEAALLRPQETPGYLLLVPTVDGRVIGWCRVFAGPFTKTRHVADVGIGLLAPYREQGIGTMLMERAISWAGGLVIE
jgi:GNAT superfamily N-acetyltransferase